MPYASADGVKLYYEECGKGLPVILVHEFAGDMRSWEPQDPKPVCHPRLHHIPGE